MIKAEVIEEIPTPTEWKGPRKLPKPDARKKARKRARAARKRNRGVYSGQ